MSLFELLSGREPVCRILALVTVRSVSGHFPPHMGIVLDRRRRWRVPLRDGGAPTLNNFAGWHYRVWCPSRGPDPRWVREHAIQVVEDPDDVAEAIRLIRESEVNPPDHGLLLVNDDLVIGEEPEPDTWILQLVSPDDLFTDTSARALEAWNNNAVLSLNLGVYYSTEESELDSEEDA